MKDDIDKSWKYFEPQFEYQEKYPDTDPSSAWIGHKFFAYDLIRNTHPKIVVELGTHKGASFFSICQAVKDGKLKTKLFAVDTWKGDKHSGFYDKTILNEVIKIKDSCYSKQNIFLLKSLFDDAITKFEDNSIDILHIDGLHTYEAVKHDFDNWFNKVKKNGIIMFHDTNEKKGDFGVYKLWDKLKKEYKTLEFFHSHGLGILFKNQTFNQDQKIFEIIWQKYYPILTDKKMLKTQLRLSQIETEKIKKDLSQKLQQKLQQVENYKREFMQIKIENQNLVNTLNMIKSAKFFKLWQRYCIIRDKILEKVNKNNEKKEGN